MQPIAKAPPQSSTILYGHGSRAYSSISMNFVYLSESHIADIKISFSTGKTEGIWSFYAALAATHFVNLI